MIQDPSPTDDPEMEKFCEWLYEEGTEPCLLSFEQLKNIWQTGLRAVSNKLDKKVNATQAAWTKAWQAKKEATK